MAEHQQQEVVRRIPRADLHPSPFQTRRRESRASLADLAASIAANDVLEPVVCRPRAEGGFELVFGHRRTAACEFAGLDDVPAIVRNYTDAQASAAVVAENLHRKDLRPLEEAAAVEVALREHGGDPAATAAALGVDERFVARRAHLLRLAPCWRVAAADPASVVSGWTAAHLEVVARLARGSQEAAFEELRYAMPARPTVRRLAQLLASFLLELRGAPWPLDDASLHPEAGACSRCPKRTSRAPLLFGDVRGASGRGDRCRDAACWNEKRRRLLLRQLEAAREAGAVVYAVHVGEAPPDDLSELAGDFVPVSALRRTERETGVVAFVVDGPGRGERFSVEPPDSPPPRSPARRTAEVAKRLRLIAAARVEALEHAPHPVLQLAAAFGLRGIDDPWVALARYSQSMAVAVEWEAWQAVRSVIGRRLREQRDAELTFAEVARASEALGLDFDALVEEAERP